MHNLTEAQWTDRFLSRLDRLLPDFSIVDATAWAIKTYQVALDLEPEDGAEIFAREHAIERRRAA